MASASAAICGKIVEVPVPISWLPDSTNPVPSAVRRTRAAAAMRKVVMTALATP